MENIWYVRLKPYDPKRNHVMQRYAEVAWPDVVFLQGARPVGISIAAAKHLKKIHQRHNDPGSPKAFNVWETKEAMIKDLREEYFAALPQPSQPMAQASSKPPPLGTVLQIPDVGAPATRADQIAMLEEQPQPDAPVIAVQEVDLEGAFDGMAPTDEELESLESEPPTPRPPKARRGSRPRPPK